MRKAPLAALMLWAFIAVFGQKPGVERWPLKTSLAPGGGKAQTITFANLAALPNAPGVTHNDKRYQSTLIPGKIGGKYTEGQLLTVTGYLWLVGAEPDGDYHIQISGSATSGDGCVIVEVPNPDPTYTADTKLQPQAEAVRTLIKTKMLRGKDPSPSGSVMQHPVYVTVTGALFYDDAHVGTAPRGKKGMHAAGLWELHPVTAIAFAPKP